MAVISRKVIAAINLHSPHILPRCLCGPQPGMPGQFWATEAAEGCKLALSERAWHGLPFLASHWAQESSSQLLLLLENSPQAKMCP